MKHPNQEELATKAVIAALLKMQAVSALRFRQDPLAADASEHAADARACERAAHKLWIKGHVDLSTHELLRRHCPTFDAFTVLEAEEKAERAAAELSAYIFASRKPGWCATALEISHDMQVTATAHAHKQKP